MKVNHDFNHGLSLEFTDFDTKELKLIKERWVKQLTEYIHLEREDLDLAVSLHIRDSDKINELTNLRLHILNDLDYNRGYHNVVDFKDGKVCFPDQNEFLLFACSYNILDDITRGQRVLKNILRTKVIEWLVKYQYAADKQLKIKFSSPAIQHEGQVVDYFPFTKNGKLFFELCMKESEIRSRKFISILYGFLKSKGFITGNQIDFARYYNEHFETPQIIIYDKSAGLDSMDWTSSYVNDFESQLTVFRQSQPNI